MYNRNLAAVTMVLRPEGALRTFQLIMKTTKKSDSA